MSIAQKCDLNPKHYNVRKAFGSLLVLYSKVQVILITVRNQQDFFLTYCEFLLLFKTFKYDKRKHSYVHGFNFSQPINYAFL